MSLQHETPSSLRSKAKMMVAVANLMEAMNSADSSLTDHSSHEAVRTAVQQIPDFEGCLEMLERYLEQLDLFNQNFVTIFPNNPIVGGIWMPIVPLIQLWLKHHGNNRTLEEQFGLLAFVVECDNEIFAAALQTFNFGHAPENIASTYVNIICCYITLFEDVTSIEPLQDKWKDMFLSRRAPSEPNSSQARDNYLKSDGVPRGVKRRAIETDESVTTELRNFNPEGCNADQRERGHSVINKDFMAEQSESLNGSSEGQMETGLGEIMEVSSAELRNLNLGGGSADQRESEGITGSRAPAEATIDGKLGCDDDAGAEKEAIYRVARGSDLCGRC